MGGLVLQWHFIVLGLDDVTERLDDRDWVAELRGTASL